MVRIFALIALLCLAGIGHAQQWPAKPVRVFVNVAPGGVADVTMRLLGARLTEEIAEPMTPDAFAAYVKAESERYGRLLPELGIAK